MNRLFFVFVFFLRRFRFCSFRIRMDGLNRKLETTSVELSDRVLTIWLNRPSRFNAYTARMVKKKEKLSFFFGSLCLKDVLKG